MTVERALHVRGDWIIDGTGEQVFLRGVGLGGWMTMEKFITGYPGTESQKRRALGRVLGPTLPMRSLSASSRTSSRRPTPTTSLPSATTISRTMLNHSH
jgi:hypothetical protein